MPKVTTLLLKGCHRISKVVGVADVVKVSALVVGIDSEVRILGVAATKMDVGVTPPQNVAQ